MAYLNVNEVESAIIALSRKYPNFTKLITLPHKSVEQRTSHALHLSSHFQSKRNTIFLTGGVHAREWGSCEICVFLAADLLEAYDQGTGLVYGGKNFTSTEIKSLFESIDFVIFPDVNPDGRLYSQTIEALWRRNRNPADSGGNNSCVGVDINRNFDFLWNFPDHFSPLAPVRTSTDPCSIDQTYHGSTPASEHETQNVIWIFDNFPQIKWYVDIHSYGEKILTNWGDDENQSNQQNMNFMNPAFDTVRGLKGDNAYKEYISNEDRTVTLALANAMHQGIKAVRGRNYQVQQAFDLYPTSGTSDDYAYSRHMTDPNKGKIYGFTIEWGREFQPPWTEMQQIVSEVSAGIIQFSESASGATP
ncbi:M14 family metallopeptidase [Paenibacillus sp. S-12]|uniref:M14 family metallopeptidase n=1 Tax=Paenibacillus sp. S-12 TaxID=3031371 RepID=UPI0025A207E9|nr:M14 family metallopeptidase [Paenibacillus sp. S-12]